MTETLLPRHPLPPSKGKKCNLRVSVRSVTYVSGRSPTTFLSGLLPGHPFVADGFRLILFLFFLGILSGIGYGFDSLGDRIHSLFPPALAVNHNLRPCVFAQHTAGMHGCGSSENTLYHSTRPSPNL